MHYDLSFKAEYVYYYHMEQAKEKLKVKLHSVVLTNNKYNYKNCALQLDILDVGNLLKDV